MMYILPISMYISNSLYFIPFNISHMLSYLHKFFYKEKRNNEKYQKGDKYTEILLKILRFDENTTTFQI